jgi:hypothetical protein
LIVGDGADEGAVDGVFDGIFVGAGAVGVGDGCRPNSPEINLERKSKRLPIKPLLPLRRAFWVLAIPFCAQGSVTVGEIVVEAITTGVWLGG